ncbi:riboflavin biosynthesis protein RibD [Chloroherpeton thalassium ATCC 35110]|uniref:Riboflavin biosynthesis protein RibD n=1 Tax=Chloroherpeton thalassium (strain ATCC 35110 / GB-78) TaxID=517418 RepID=B3QVD0_CHLT3|nr:bifunctional diaminohydroxyphosphoribosylaminopyrimidine deaminase/5-amino-6-(5-phosphoribosylamino)uracil reductase RibD [Chloroherpeton thalassium]ACF14530.1 riboflavin biosynthesis protein RibD [Chloroherpeton thalassium ATCC 35110]
MQKNFSEDEFYIDRCLKLAKKGAGFVSPNPLVGSVIVHNGKIIGEGFHEVYGGPHAEVNAIGSVAQPILLQESTLYVNLEPCAHFGKTPPCADLIIRHKIPRVVIGCLDPFEHVSGKGAEKLRHAGVEVKVGVLESEALRLNEAFIHFHIQKRPFVALKFAQTLDGKIATTSGDSKWITNKASRTLGHQLRSWHSAILIGTNTALADDPELTVRHVEGKNPVRVLLDRRLSVPLTAKIFNAAANTLVFTSSQNTNHPKVGKLNEKNVEVFFVTENEAGLSFSEIFQVLYEKKLLSVYVEGGSGVYSRLIQEGYCEKFYGFIAPKIVGGDGLATFRPLEITNMAEAVSLRFHQVQMLDGDIFIEGYFNH